MLDAPGACRQHSVVRNLFPTAITLEDYLFKFVCVDLAVVGSTDVIGDAVQLCKDVLIVPNRDLLPLEVSPGQGTVCRSRSSSVQEVLNRLVSVDVRAKSNTREQDRNILSLGYRLKRWQSELGMRCTNDIECFFVNTVHSLYLTSSWRQLLRIIGDEHFLVLLAQTMLQPIGRGCFVQISGVPVPRMLYGQSDGVASAGAARSRQTDAAALKITGSTVLPRSKIFYHSKRVSVPCIRCRTGDIDASVLWCSCREGHVGLPANHILRSKVGCGVGRGIGLVYSQIVTDSAQINGLDQLYDNLKLNYFTSRISRALNIYCPLTLNKAYEAKDAVKLPENDSSERSALHLNTSESAKDTGQKRKTRRGTRAGSHIKSRRLSLDAASELMKGVSPSEEISALLTPICHVSHKSNRTRACDSGQRKRQKFTAVNIAVPPRQAKKGKIPHLTTGHSHGKLKKNPCSRGIITVGQRLWRRTLCSARLGVRYYRTKAERAEFRSAGDAVIAVSEFSTQPEETEMDGDSLCMPILSSIDSGAMHGVWGSLPGGLRRNIADRRYLTQTSTQPTTSGASAETPIRSTQPTCASRSEVTDAYSSTLDSDRMNPFLSTSESSRTCKVYPNPDVIICASFQELSCGHNSVSAFMRVICLHLFPLADVWGCRRNLSAFLSAVDKYVRLGRSESATVEMLCRQIKVSAIPWIKLNSKKNDGDNIDKSASNVEAARQRTYFLAFMHWIYAEVLNPILRSCFYITEGESYGNEVLYYRHPIWQRLCRIGAAQLRENFVEVFPGHNGLTPDNTSLSSALYVGNAPANVAPTQLWCIPSVRLVPKKKSMRPITNLRSAFLRARLTKASGVVSDHSRLQRNHNGSTAPQSAVGISAAPSDYAPLPFLMTNSTLYNILHVLRDMMNKKPELSGFGVSGSDEIYTKIRNYKYNLVRQLSAESSSSTKIYRYVDVSQTQFFIATLDLEKCFDSMDTAQLFDLVQQLVLGESDVPLTDIDTAQLGNYPDVFDDENTSLVHKYSISHYIPSLEKKVVKSVKHVTKGNDLIPFSEAIGNLSQTNRHCIITDGVIYPSLSRQKLLQQLKLHLFSHIVRIPSAISSNDSDKNDGSHCNDYSGYSYFTQVKGIPQGSVLSPILCNLFYGNAEAKEFGSPSQLKLLCLDEGKSLIIRMMDDYIMISTEREATNHFLQKMHSVMQFYGGGVNPLKTRVNFDTDICVNGVTQRLPRLNQSAGDADHFIVWCGWAINTVTLEVHPSFDKLLQRPISSSVSVGTKSCGTLLRLTMKSFLRPKCHSIVLDPFLNSRLTILESISSIFIVGGLRGYIQCSRMRVACGYNCRFLYKCISEAVLYGVNLIKVRSPNILFSREVLSGRLTAPHADNENSPLVKTHSTGSQGIQQFIQIQCVAYMSMLKVYEKKSSKFTMILRLLSKKLSRLQQKITPEKYQEAEEAINSRAITMILNTAKWY